MECPNYGAMPLQLQDTYQHLPSFPNQLPPSSASCDYADWSFEETSDLHQISLIDMVLTDPYAPNFSLLHESFFHYSSEGYSCDHNQHEEEEKKAMKYYSNKRSKNESDLSIETISKHFYLPITEAAKAMKVGLTLLKRRCRELGIRRWPRRKLMSLQTLINNLKKEMENDGGDEKTREALEREKKVLEEVPDMELQGETKRLRQACFKSNFKKRKLMEMNHENTTPTHDCVSMLEEEFDEEIMSFLSDL